MLQQLEQSIQQTFSGLTLGSPLRAQDCTTEFVKNNPPIVLTNSKRIDQELSALDDNYDDWNQDTWSSPDSDVNTNTDVHAEAGATAACTQAATTVNLDETARKKIDNSTRTTDQLRRGFPPGTTRPRALIYGQPTGVEDNFEDYFNPCIVGCHTLFTTSPSFTVAVNIRRNSTRARGGYRPPPRTSTETRESQRPRPWDNKPYGQKTRSQDALRARAQKKIARRYPNYRSRNSPRSRYVRDFQVFSKISEISVERNIVQELDLATAFPCPVIYQLLQTAEQINWKQIQQTRSSAPCFSHRQP